MGWCCHALLQSTALVLEWLWQNGARGASFLPSLEKAGASCNTPCIRKSYPVSFVLCLPCNPHRQVMCKIRMKPSTLSVGQVTRLFHWNHFPNNTPSHPKEPKPNPSHLMVLLLYFKEGLLICIRFCLTVGGTFTTFCSMKPNIFLCYCSYEEVKSSLEKSCDYPLLFDTQPFSQRMLFCFSSPH